MKISYYGERYNRPEKKKPTAEEMVKAIWKSTGNGQRLRFDEIREIQSGKSKYSMFKIEAIYRKYVGAL